MSRNKEFAKRFVETLDPVDAAQHAGIDNPYDLAQNDDEFRQDVEAEFEKQCSLWDLVPMGAIRTYLFGIVADKSMGGATRVRAAQSLIDSEWRRGKADDRLGNVIRAIQGW